MLLKFSSLRNWHEHFLSIRISLWKKLCGKLQLHLQHQRNVSVGAHGASMKKRQRKCAKKKVKRHMMYTRCVLRCRMTKTAKADPWHLDRCGVGQLWGQLTLSVICQTQAKAPPKKQKTATSTAWIVAYAHKWLCAMARCFWTRAKTLTTFSIVWKMQMCHQLPAPAPIATPVPPQAGWIIHVIHTIFVDFFTLTVFRTLLCVLLVFSRKIRASHTWLFIYPRLENLINSHNFKVIK